MEGADKSDSPKNICQFYLEDRCRFGSECHNLHEGPIKPISTSKQKKSNSKNVTKNLKLALLLLQFEKYTIYLVDSNKNPLTILTFLDQLGLSHPTYY